MSTQNFQDVTAKLHQKTGALGANQSTPSTLADPQRNRILDGHTGHQAIIGHQQLSDTVGLYGVFLHTPESRQFRRGKGHRSKSQNTKK